MVRERLGTPVIDHHSSPSKTIIQLTPIEERIRLSLHSG